MTTETVTTTTDIDALLARLVEAHAARTDPLDLPRTLSQREVNDYRARTVNMARVISGLRDGVGQLETAQRELAPCEEDREAWLAKREELRRHGYVSDLAHLEAGTK